MKDSYSIKILHGIARRWRFLLLWIVSTGFAAIGGHFEGNLLFTSLWGIFGGSWFESPEATICLITINFASIGIWLAVLQWLLVRKRYPWAIDWFKATLFGVILGVASLLGIGSLMYENLAPIVETAAYRIPLGAALGCILGLSIGLMQGFILNKYYRQKYAWTIASAIGWMIGGALSYPVFLGAVSGIVTGVVICQMIENPRNALFGQGLPINELSSKINKI